MAAKFLGFKDGFDGLLEEGGVSPISVADVRGILPRGGTILGTANRGNPFARQVNRDGHMVVEDTSDQIIASIQSLALDALIVVGGDGTLHIAQKLFERGVPVVGVPKTIDNDIGGTEFTFGFDTALNIAMEALDRLHTTAEAHHRVMLLELMGRDAGFITLHAGLAGGADVILIPEIPFQYDAICHKVMERAASRQNFSIIAVSEGARPEGEGQVYSRSGNAVYSPRLGGIANQVANRSVNARPGVARDRAGTLAARRQSHCFRPLAGHPLRRCCRAAGAGGRLWPHGCPALRENGGCAPFRSFGCAHGAWM